MNLAGLAAISVACGFAASFVFRRTTDTGAVRAARRRLYARLLEFRLFADDPALIWRAQKALLRDNVRLLLLLARPALILLLPMAWIFAQVDWLYGYGPLPLGKPAIVTAQLAGPLEASDAEASLKAPPGISVETPPVRAWHDRQISWRIRPVRAAEGVLELTVRGRTIKKTLTAGHSWERRIANGDVLRVEVDYPRDGLPAALWFLAISAAGTLAFNRWLGHGFDD